MENRFDTLAKALAGSVSRREALSRVGFGVAGLLLAGWNGRKAWANAPESGCESYCRGLIDPRQSHGAFGACVSSCEACVQQSGALCGLAAGGGVTCCTGPTPFCGAGVCLSCCDFCNFQLQQAEAACSATFGPSFDACVAACCAGGCTSTVLENCNGSCGISTGLNQCVIAAQNAADSCNSACSC